MASLNRRDLLKGLAAIPVLGALGVGAYAKNRHDANLKSEILEELNIQADTPPLPGISKDTVRIGIIGFGIRGRQLTKAIGYADKGWISSMEESARKNGNDNRLRDYLSQDQLNVRITGVCDLFDVRADEAVAAGTTDDNTPQRYRHYEDMLNSSDIDAVIIATPDHWHAPIAIAAAQAGKHVYVEKCMTHKIQETYDLYDAITRSGIVFQVGHQHRQTQSFITARDILQKKVLGHVSLIQANTNRNSDNGAWQYPIHEKANMNTVDWQQFLGNAPQIPFNAEHFFRWRKWWAYGTGLSGDLLTHDYDRINCLLEMGIPHSVVASGGIYTHIDGREVPDVFQVVMEYPEFSTGGSQEAGKEKGMTFMYSATLGNQYDGRSTALMGHDATMELGNSLMVYADPRSTRYADMLKNKTIKSDVPLYAYTPNAKGVDGITSATAAYFANKGLLYTYRDGKRMDPTHIHLREWLSAIRDGGSLSCGIEEGFQEAISAHMATLSYRSGRRVEWDPATRSIKNLEAFDLEAVNMV